MREYVLEKINSQKLTDLKVRMNCWATFYIFSIKLQGKPASAWLALAFFMEITLTHSKAMTDKDRIPGFVRNYILYINIYNHHRLFKHL